MSRKPIDEAVLDRACEAYAEIAGDYMGFVRRRAMREALTAAQQGQAVEPAPPSAPVGAAEDMVLDAIERRESSAPVGVDAPGSRAWMAEVCRAAALSLAAHGVRNDQLSKVADWIAQQPAAVDEAYPTPRNRAEAVALARLALAHLGVIDAHIDAAIARCETNSATQRQEPKS